MSETPNKPARTTGLSPKEQKLQALREKMLHKNSGTKPQSAASATGFQGKSALGAKKTSFQRKAT